MIGARTLICGSCVLLPLICGFAIVGGDGVGGVDGVAADGGGDEEGGGGGAGVCGAAAG